MKESLGLSADIVSLAWAQALPEPQWLKVDIRSFDMSVLGKFGVIMADPPWEIHQDLPYGTMADVEMRQMKIGDLQDDGVIFLWVTGSIPAPMWHDGIVLKNGWSP
jgi:hypothetical protein